MTLAVPRSMPIFMTRRFVLRGPRNGRNGRSAEGEAAGASWGRVGRADDAGTQLLELAVDVLIPPLNVMGAVDQRAAVRRQRGEDQRGTGAQVADRRLRPVEPRGPMDRGVVG